MASALVRFYRLGEALPVVGTLLRSVRSEVDRALVDLLDSLVRNHLDVDAIVARLAIDDVVSRLEIDEIVRRLDLAGVVDRLDIDEIVARLELDNVIARLDMDEIVARIDFARLAGKVVEDIDLRQKIKRSAASVVRTRRPS